MRSVVFWNQKLKCGHIGGSSKADNWHYPLSTIPSWVFWPDVCFFSNRGRQQSLQPSRTGHLRQDENRNGRRSEKQRTYLH